MEVSAILMLLIKDGRFKLSHPEYYWLDLQRLNEIYRFKSDKFGKEIDSISMLNQFPWLTGGCPNRGYLAGNLGPGHMDFPSLLA